MGQTHSQKMAQAAYVSVLRRFDPKDKDLPEKYASFARSFLR